MTSPAYLIQDVRIFDGIGVTHTCGSILIQGGVIISVTPGRLSSVPKGTVVIDGNGKTLLPGLIDAHIHAGDDVDVLKQSLRFGVTTVLDMHNEPDIVAKMVAAAQNDDSCSDFKSACLAATVKDGWPAPIFRMFDQSGKVDEMIAHWPQLESPEQAEAFVKKNIALGASYIKIMQESGHTMRMDLPTPSIALQAAVIEAAHNHELLAVAHCMSAEETLLLLKAGVDGMMHTSYDVPPKDSFISAYRNSGAFVVPTLAVLASATGNIHLAQKIVEDDRVGKRLEKASMENMHRCMGFAIPTATFENAFNTVTELHKAGVDIVCGSDSSPSSAGTAVGISTHHELSLYVEYAGLTPVEALRSATSIAARRFKLDDRGCVRVGLRADLILVKGDPTEDILCTLDIEKVWKRGVELP